MLVLGCFRDVAPFAVALAIGVGTVACIPREPTAPKEGKIRLMTGLIGSGYYGLGQAMARAYAIAHPAVELEVIEGTGSVSTVEAIQSGDADVGFTLADVAYLAFTGRLTDRQTRFERIRGLSVLQLTPLQLVVRTKSSIRGVPDLKGRSVVVGPTGSGTPFTVALVLRAFGVAPGSVRTVAVPFKEGANLLRSAAVDAMFLNATYPAENVKNAIAAGAHLVSIDGAPVNALRSEYPFFRLARIPAETYPNQPESIYTIGTDAVIVCRDDLEELTAYELTKQFFDLLPVLPAPDSLRLMNLDSAAATPIPLHQGAARYFRERELFR
jgi:TRAP transporter TAXI family solute receptor